MNPQRVHFVGIGGTGMGSLAGLLHARGIAVTGSDEKLYPPMSTALAGWGIPVREGFAAEHVTAAQPELVVIGNVCRPDNPEARAAIDGGYAYLSFSDALYQLAMREKHSLVVTGTHGKTTTAAMLASVLVECGRDPSVLVGGIAANLDGSFREGAGPDFVVEGDEYDTAFFDKTPKFLHYHPRTAILTSLEFDHADIYRDLDHVKSAFRELVSGMPADGCLIVFADDANVADVAADAPCRVVPYGARAGSWRAGDLRPGSEGTRFAISRDGAPLGEAQLAAWGEHNVANALAAVAAAAERGVAPEEAVRALTRYRGVRRRLEVRGEIGGVVVLDDFAHHPTAVRATLAAVRARYPGRRLVAVFEPRSNTSRRALFQKDYAAALAGADRVAIRAVPDAPIYSAFGEVGERLDAHALAQQISAAGPPAEAIEDVDALAEQLAADAAPGDVLLVMSNGDFDGLFEKLLPRLNS
jgi:UDP-N-acetylmuramate: L-alanyl-gamma-D-glutamyl-meso-diaminopimelate ligase